MINFLNNWIEQIAISAIIVSVFELILPNGNLKKYIKIILGVYIIFCLISPFVNASELYNLDDIKLDEYVDTSKAQTNLNQTSIDSRLQELYIDQLKNDIKLKVEEHGYTIYKCNIDADLNTSSENPGIHEIDLILENNKNLNNIEKIEINPNSKQEEIKDENIDKLRQDLANNYEIDKNIINIKVK